VQCRVNLKEAVEEQWHLKFLEKKESIILFISNSHCTPFPDIEILCTNTFTVWTYISLSDLTTASFYSDILAADQTRAMQEQMQMQMQMPQDPSKAFKVYWTIIPRG